MDYNKIKINILYQFYVYVNWLIIGLSIVSTVRIYLRNSSLLFLASMTKYCVNRKTRLMPDICNFICQYRKTFENLLL